MQHDEERKANEKSPRRGQEFVIKGYPNPYQFISTDDEKETIPRESVKNFEEIRFLDLKGTGVTKANILIRMVELSIKGLKPSPEGVIWTCKRAGSDNPLLIALLNKLGTKEESIQPGDFVSMSASELCSIRCEGMYSNSLSESKFKLVDYNPIFGAQGHCTSRSLLVRYRKTVIVVALDMHGQISKEEKNGEYDCFCKSRIRVGRSIKDLRTYEDLSKDEIRLKTWALSSSFHSRNFSLEV